MVSFLFRICILLTLAFGSATSAKDTVNPWKLSIEERILTRKNISHIVLDPRKDHTRLTILSSERFPYNYKGKSFPFYIKVADANRAIQIMEEWDKHLDSGYEMYIRLNGSEIADWRLLR